MFRKLLASEFSLCGKLSSDQLGHLEKHYQLLVRWNQKLNLTRISQLEDAVRLHYCESLFLALCLPEGSWRIVDVGSGAGFPGIPVAVFRPDSEVVLLESHRRKAVFLQEAARDLANVRVLAQRAEDCQNGYDWMIARGIRAEIFIKLRLAPNFALLMGANDAVTIPGHIRIEKIPWGNRRVLVSRETK